MDTIHILIIDDNAADRQMYKSYLMEDKSCHYRFTECNLGREAAEQFRQVKPHCVLLDYYLPDMEGTRVLDMLIEEGQGLGELFFCKGELYRHRADEGDSRKARDAYEMAIGAGDAPPEVYRSFGLVLRRESETQAAGAAFRRYLELHPAAPDAPMIKSYLVSGS